MTRDQLHGRKANILVVEDNPGDVRLTEEALRSGEIPSALHWVKDGVEAIEFLHKRGRFADRPTPDLILLDLNLPRKGGREVLAEIKAEEELQRIPVVVLSSSRAAEDIQSSYALRANCYIAKPTGLDDYLSAIAAIDRFWLGVVELPAT